MAEQPLITNTEYRCKGIRSICLEVSLQSLREREEGAYPQSSTNLCRLAVPVFSGRKFQATGRQGSVGWFGLSNPELKCPVGGGPIFAKPALDGTPSMALCVLLQLATFRAPWNCRDIVIGFLPAETCLQASEANNDPGQGHHRSARQRATRQDRASSLAGHRDGTKSLFG